MIFKHPKLGDATPWKKKFAFFPVCVKKPDGWYTIWLAYYMQRKVYTRRYRATKFGIFEMDNWDVQYKPLEAGKYVISS